MSVTTQGPLRASKMQSNTTPSASKSAIVSLFCKPRETEERGRWGFPRLSSALPRPAFLCTFSLLSRSLLYPAAASQIQPQLSHTPFPHSSSKPVSSASVPWASRWVCPSKSDGRQEEVPALSLFSSVPQGFQSRAISISRKLPSGREPRNSPTKTKCFQKIYRIIHPSSSLFVSFIYSFVSFPFKQILLYFISYFKRKTKSFNC